MFGEHRLPACWFWRLAKTIFQIRRSLREIVVRTLPTTAGWQPALPEKRSVDAKSKSSLDRPYENKNDCITSGTVLCSMYSLILFQPSYGHVEAERGQIES